MIFELISASSNIDMNLNEIISFLTKEYEQNSNAIRSI